MKPIFLYRITTLLYTMRLIKMQPDKFSVLQHENYKYNSVISVPTVQHMAQTTQHYLS